jgi:hypothetical protein
LGGGVSKPVGLSEPREDQGRSVANIREAIRGYIAALEEDKLAVPEERFDAVLMEV